MLLVAIAWSIASLPVAVFAEAAWLVNGVPVCITANSQESPYVVSVGSGGMVVVWADTRGDDYDIYAQKLDANGNQVWTQGGVNVCGGTYDQQFPAAVEDGAGGVIVVWQDGRLGDDGLALYAQRVLPDGTVAWQVNGLPVCSYAEGLADPPMAFSHVVTSDGNGGLITAWRDTRNDPIAGNTEIFVQAIDGAGTPKWATNGVKILGFGALKWSTRNPVVVSDGSGGAVVVWQDARNTAITANDLYAQHVSSSGSPTWTNNGIPVCDAAGEQGYPDIARIAGVGTVVVWEDKRSGNYDIYAQSFDDLGVPQWGANGLLVCSSPNDQRTPRVCSDGSGGLIVAWTDKRSSTASTDVYAQRLNSYGSVVWEPQGTPICTAPGSQTRIRMAGSVPGYTLFSWMDTRNETLAATYDVYGQYIDAAAQPQWDPAGIPVAAITGTNQRLQQATSDASGGLFVVWEDNRNAGDWDIYAQRLSPWMPTSGIAEARSLLTGTPVFLSARVVTGSFSGCFYIEEEHRNAGIRVESSGVFAPGTAVTVAGIVQFGLEPFIKAYSVVPAGTLAVPGPLGVTASGLGNAAFGSNPGLTNAGLLVRTWGTVVSVHSLQQPYIVIEDGQTQIRVYCTADVDVGDTVAVTGVCSGETNSSGTVATVLTRDDSDVIKLNP